MVELQPMAFLNKKYWHPGRLSNLETKWKREQEAEQEKKKLDELRKQIEEERQREDLHAVAEAAGVRQKEDRLDWMYQGGVAARQDAEKRAEEALLTGAILDAPAEQPKSRADNLAQLPSFYAEDTPASANETWARLHNDPLFAIKQQELAARKKVLNNPMTMLTLKKEVAAVKEKKKDKKKEKKEKKDKKKHKRDESPNGDKRARDASLSPAAKRSRRMYDEGKVTRWLTEQQQEEDDSRGAPVSRHEAQPNRHWRDQDRRNNGDGHQHKPEDRRGSRYPREASPTEGRRHADRANERMDGRDAARHENRGRADEHRGHRRAHEDRGKGSQAKYDDVAYDRGKDLRAGDRERSRLDKRHEGRRDRYDDDAHHEQRSKRADCDDIRGEQHNGHRNGRHDGEREEQVHEQRRGKEEHADERDRDPSRGKERSDAAVGVAGRRYGLDYGEKDPEQAVGYDRSALAEATRRRLEEAAKRKAQEEREAASMRAQRREHQTGKLSAEQKAAKLAEMMRNAEEHEAQRVAKIHEADHAERAEKQQDVHRDAAKFLKESSRALTASGMTAAEQIARRKHYSDHKTGFI